MKGNVSTCYMYNYFLWSGWIHKRWKNYSSRMWCIQQCWPQFGLVWSSEYPPPLPNSQIGIVLLYFLTSVIQWEKIIKLHDCTFVKPEYCKSKDSWNQCTGVLFSPRVLHIRHIIRLCERLQCDWLHCVQSCRWWIEPFSIVMHHTRYPTFEWRVTCVKPTFPPTPPSAALAGHRACSSQKLG